MKINLKGKTICGILILALILTLVSTIISYKVYANAMDTHYQSLAINIASTAANIVDKTAVKTHTQEVMQIYNQNPMFTPQNQQESDEYFAQFDAIIDEDFYTIFDQLKIIKENNHVLFLYIAYLDVDTQTGVYIVDADSGQTACKPGTWQPAFAQIENPNAAIAPNISNTEEFGWLITSGVPILDENGNAIAHVFVDVSMDEVMTDRYEFLRNLVIILTVITILLILFFIWFVNKSVVSPLKLITTEVSNFVNEQGEISKNLHKVKTGDEISELAQNIYQMEIDIRNFITNLTQITTEKERISSELNIATSIQASMLPSIFPAFPEQKHFDIYATMTPAKEVGGDFYDFFLVDDDHLALVMADVSGKGVPAALFMVIAKILIKNAVSSGMSPNEALQVVNNQLCEGNDAELFVTVWLGVLEISTGKLTAANAGHEYPTIMRKGEIFELYKDKHGFVLAGMPNAKYTQYDMYLQPNDKLFVYTDGVPEATNSEKQLFGTTRMLESLNNCKDKPVMDILAHVKTDVDTFVGTAPQFDDITMLAIEFF